MSKTQTFLYAYMKISYKKPMYLTAGNFPSIAANTIQIAKMAAAYSSFLPNLEVVALTGPQAYLDRNDTNLTEIFGLSSDLNIRYLPLLTQQTQLMFSSEYRPPQWFYKLIGYYALVQQSDLVFTRKDATAIITLEAGIKTILETHALWSDSPLLHRYIKLLNSDLSSIVVITHPIAQSFINAGINPEKIIIEPDGVDIEEFTPQLSKTEARRILGIDIKQKLCVYAGHLYDNRGINEIIAAAASLPNVNFLFIGGWEKDVRKYQERIQALSLDNIIFKGHRPHREIPTWLFAADVLLMPYNSQLSSAGRCSPLKMFEYLAAGRVIIATDLPILHSVLKHERNALLIEPNSSTALAEAIERIYRDTNLEDTLSQNARSCSINYSWRERAQRILTHIGHIE